MVDIDYKVVQFICQYIICLFIIILSGYNLSQADKNKDIWLSLFCSTLGYCMPNPPIPKLKKQVSHE